MAIEVLFQQYSITLCWNVTEGSRGAVWQNCVWHGSVDEVKVCHWIPPSQRNYTCWHLPMLAGHYWRPSSVCELSEAVVDVFQEWQRRNDRQAVLWMALQIFTSIACRLLFITGKSAQLMMEIKLKNKSKNIVSIYIHQWFWLFLDTKQAVSTVRWWVVCFSSGDSDRGAPPLVQIIVFFFA